RTGCPGRVQQSEPGDCGAHSAEIGSHDHEVRSGQWFRVDHRYLEALAAEPDRDGGGRGGHHKAGGGHLQRAVGRCCPTNDWRRQAASAEAGNGYGRCEACSTQVELVTEIAKTGHLWCRESSMRPRENAAFLFVEERLA